MVHKEKQVIVNFTLTQMSSWCISYNQYIQIKIKNKLGMKSINYACFKLEENATKVLKRKKNSFINVIGDKFTMSIRWERSTISFCKELFSYINYFQLLILSKYWEVWWQFYLKWHYIYVYFVFTKNHYFKPF